MSLFDNTEISAEALQGAMEKMRLQRRGKATPYRIEDPATFPRERAEVIVDGFVRRGHVLNIVAASKAKKSWMAAQLALSVANGLPWLGRHTTTQGDVLLIDGELDRAEVRHRLDKVADAMGVEWEGKVRCLPLADEIVHPARLQATFDEIDAGAYSLILLDPLYTLIGADQNENDNAQMGALFSFLRRSAMRLNCAIAVVHHLSKGANHAKSLTDLGAGAGAMNRSCAALIGLLPHGEEDHMTMESVARSFPDTPATVLRWDFPLWHLAEGVEPRRKGADPRRDKQKDQMLVDLARLEAALRDRGGLSAREAAGVLECGRERAGNLLSKLALEGKADTPAKHGAPWTPATPTAGLESEVGEEPPL